MATSPLVRFSEFAVSGVSPSGDRHLKTHASYVKELGIAASQYLNFGSLNISNGKQSSPTKAVVAMVDNMNDALSALFNLKFWLSDVSAFTGGTYYLNGLASGVWIQNAALTDASGMFVPIVLPSGQNIWRQDGGDEIIASGLDSQVTQYFYLSTTLDIDVPVGIKGGDSGGFVYRFTYDFR